MKGMRYEEDPKAGGIDPTSSLVRSGTYDLSSFSGTLIYFLMIYLGTLRAGRQNYDVII